MMKYDRLTAKSKWPSEASSRAARRLSAAFSSKAGTVFKVAYPYLILSGKLPISFIPSGVKTDSG